MAMAARTAAAGSAGVDGTLATDPGSRAVARRDDDVGERPSGVDPDVHRPRLARRHASRDGRSRVRPRRRQRRAPAPARVLDGLEEIAPGADGPHLEAQLADAAPQPQHVHVERVAGRAAARPRPPHERVAADDRAEPVDQRGGQRTLHRRERHPSPPVAQQAVDVDVRRGGRVAGPGRERRDPGAEVVLGRGEPDPVLERVDRGSAGRRSSPTRSRRGAPDARSRSSRPDSSGQRTRTTSTFASGTTLRPPLGPRGPFRRRHIARRHLARDHRR